MTAKRLEIFVIATIIGIIGIIYAFTQSPVIIPERNEEVSINQSANDQNASKFVMPPQEAVATIIEYPGVDGKSALDLLKENHQVDVTHYDFGDMVNGIDGVKPDSKHFWAMYVNGQMSQVGASVYITKSSDQIRWQMDEIK